MKIAVFTFISFEITRDKSPVSTESAESVPRLSNRHRMRHRHSFQNAERSAVHARATRSTSSNVVTPARTSRSPSSCNVRMPFATAS